MGKDRNTSIRDCTTGIILAGGAGRRMNGADKGLVEYLGQPLVAHVVNRLKPQVSTLIISCNRNTSRYAVFTNQLVHDRRPDYQGPLAGLEAACGRIQTPLLIVTPCDAPNIPPNLVERLVLPLLTDNHLDICYASDGIRPQFLFAAIRRDCLPSITPFLDAEQRAVSHWMNQHRVLEVDFSDSELGFQNINTPPA